MANRSKKQASTVSVVGKSLVFKINGADKYLSIKSKLVVPLDHVVSVSTDVVPWRRSFTELKLGGANIPRVVKDGRFLSKGKLYFYVMHDTSKCITVNLNNEHYGAIIFQVEDKERTAKEILSKVKGS